MDLFLDFKYRGDETVSAPIILQQYQSISGKTSDSSSQVEVLS